VRHNPTMLTVQMVPTVDTAGPSHQRGAVNFIQKINLDDYWSIFLHSQQHLFSLDWNIRYLEYFTSIHRQNTYFPSVGNFFFLMTNISLEFCWRGKKAKKNPPTDKCHFFNCSPSLFFIFALCHCCHLLSLQGLLHMCSSRPMLILSVWFQLNVVHPMQVSVRTHTLARSLANVSVVLISK
jgi:hypothetical protein